MSLGGEVDSITNKVENLEVDGDQTGSSLSWPVRPINEGCSAERAGPSQGLRQCELPVEIDDHGVVFAMTRVIHRDMALITT